MGHLITVQNILKLLGGPLHLERDDYPIKSEFFPFEFHLSPLSLDVLAKYVVAESPMDWPPSVSTAEKAEILQRAQGSANSAAVKRVGLLYDKLVELLGDHDKLPDELFRAETFPFQAQFDEYGRGYAAGARGDSKLTAPDVLIGRAATRTQAINALKQIAQQGEAGETIDADQEDSHFTVF